MPQLDVTTYSSQIFWLVACFFALLSMAKFYVIPRMDEIVSCRLRYVESVLEQAAKLTAEAEKIDEECKMAVASAHADIEKAEEAAIAELNKKVEAAQAELNNKNAENNSAALMSINNAIQDLSIQLNKEIPSMVNLAFNVMYDSIVRK